MTDKKQEPDMTDVRTFRGPFALEGCGIKIRVQEGGFIKFSGNASVQIPKSNADDEKGKMTLSERSNVDIS